VIVTAIYASRERDTLGISNQDVVAAMSRRAGPHPDAAHPDAAHQDARAIDQLDEVVRYLRLNAKPGDVVITFSAGDANKISADFLKADK